MIKKCFVVLQFGKPHEWTEQFFQQVAGLGAFGWHWMFFTPNKYENVPENVDIIDMDVNKFNELVEEKTGVKPTIYITDKGIPNIHVTDFMVAYGLIFEDYLDSFDFWGMMGGPDIVFGRLDHFVPDYLLKSCDIFSDDVFTINGCFTLVGNTDYNNNLFRKIAGWQDAFEAKDCPKCTGTGPDHILAGTDEYGLTEVMKNEPKLRYFYQEFYPMLSHDRLEQHVPVPQLEVKPDGSLWELFKDTASPEWIHKRPVLGKEIPYFHFSNTKKWPL